MGIFRGGAQLFRGGAGCFFFFHKGENATFVFFWGLLGGGGVAAPPPPLLGHFESQGRCPPPLIQCMNNPQYIIHSNNAQNSVFSRRGVLIIHHSGPNRYTSNSIIHYWAHPTDP